MELLFLKREVAVLKSARHPNIVTFIGKLSIIVIWQHSVRILTLPRDIDY